ncbi:MAG TPA: TauD/TfdA family dioxygenase, partial [Acidimicrobiales bacterium]|nr:TauD/TfdA family dioxygenase [Acidimicrobiales bacterium]
MTALSIKRLSETVGAEVIGVQTEQLLIDESLPGAVLAALEQYGVLVFRDLHLDPTTQVEFCHRLGEV